MPPPEGRATILGSFAYFAKTDLGHLTRSARERGVDVDFMADSGAFTAYTTGKQVSLKSYATWLQVYGPHVNAAMTLDVIGDPSASDRNTLELEQMVGGAVYVIPIFHVGSPWETLERWCASHPFVALGGGVAVGHREKAFMAWLIRAHKIAREHGAVLHGLGMTKPLYVDNLPFYSVDSSYWNAASRRGTVTLFDRARGRWVCVRYSDIRRSMDPTTRARTRPAYARLIRSYGGDPDALATVGFGLVRERGSEQGRADREWLTNSAMESWLNYASHLATRRTVPAPAGVRWDGPKVYLAIGSDADFNRLVNMAAHRAAHETVVSA